MLGPRGDLLAALAVLAACGQGPAPAAAPAPIRLLHTFAPAETEALNRVIAGRTPRVEASLVPFARGQALIGELLRRGQDCPDLIRIDATWLPALARAGHLVPPPAALATRDWLPEAAALARDGDRAWAVPQAVDGLAIVYRPGAVPAGTHIASLDDLEKVAAAAQAAGARHGLGLRVDGYWLIPFLRAAGADVALGAAGRLGVDGAPARAAVERFARLFTGLAAPPPAPGTEARDEARRFRAGEIALLVTGPWALAEVSGGKLDEIAVTALPGAPRGGQLLVVPRCARQPEPAWALAADLTAPAVQAEWSRQLGTIPTTSTALADGAPIARAMRDALATAQPLPEDPASALLFDDLNPALAAVVAGDATADEALAGVARAWARLLSPAGSPSGSGTP
jgi:arabinogalactan oligomer/maltooligosaccharide transport system substrate-binding protein